ncbi:hypothetical protein, partial [Tateyamaria sp.]|uniref:hypothetical protein n=1 Tax=Tateyamaria sp. TaxID=1929288 RepID=UPI00329AB120
PHFTHHLEFDCLLEFSFSTENKTVKIAQLSQQNEKAAPKGGFVVSKALAWAQPLRIIAQSCQAASGLDVEIVHASPEVGTDDIFKIIAAIGSSGIDGTGVGTAGVAVIPSAVSSAGKPT